MNSLFVWLIIFVVFTIFMIIRHYRNKYVYWDGLSHHWYNEYKESEERIVLLNSDIRSLTQQRDEAIKAQRATQKKFDTIIKVINGEVSL